MLPRNNLHTRDYLNLIGVSDLPALTSPFDPGYDPLTLEGHLEQSSHLMAILKVSMACWIVANEDATRRKVSIRNEISCSHRHGWRAIRNCGCSRLPVAVPGPLRRYRLHPDRVWRGFHGYAVGCA